MLRRHQLEGSRDRGLEAYGEVDALDQGQAHQLADDDTAFAGQGIAVGEHRLGTGQRGGLVRTERRGPHRHRPVPHDRSVARPTTSCLVVFPRRRLPGASAAQHRASGETDVRRPRDGPGLKVPPHVGGVEAPQRHQRRGEVQRQLRVVGPLPRFPAKAAPAAQLRRWPPRGGRKLRAEPSRRPELIRRSERVTDRRCQHHALRPLEVHPRSLPPAANDRRQLARSPGPASTWPAPPAARPTRVAWLLRGCDSQRLTRSADWH